MKFMRMNSKTKHKIITLITLLSFSYELHSKAFKLIIDSELRLTTSLMKLEEQNLNEIRLKQKLMNLLRSMLN